MPLPLLSNLHPVTAIDPVCPNQKCSDIGLSIAKAWTQAHKGKIWAESEGVEKGTSIRFSIPVQ